MDGKGIIGWALEIEVETHEVKVDGSSIDFDIDIGSGGNIDIELAAIKNLKTSLEVFIGCELESTTNLSSYAKIVWVNSELADLRKEFGHLIDEKLGKNDLKTINGKSLIITDPNDTDIVIDQPEPDLLNCNMTYELVDGQIVWSCDHTWDEIYTAIQDGKIVRLLVDGTTFMPFIIQNTAGAFSNSTHIELENNSTYEWNVSFTYDNGVWELHNELTPVFTSSDKTKLDSIEEGAQVNVQSDWNQSNNDAPDYIKNKPIIPDAVSGQNDGTNWTSITIGNTTKAIPQTDTILPPQSGNEGKFLTTNGSEVSWDGVPEQVNADWEASSGPSEILNKPTIPTVNNNTVTIQRNGTTIDSFTLNASSDKTINIDGVQDQITSVNKLSADLVEDGTTNKVFTSTEKTKLEGIEDGAEANVQADWNQTTTTADDYIKNKPVIVEKLDDLSDVEISDGGTAEQTYFEDAVEDYDGNKYDAIIIGDQVWMAENLRTTHYADGTSVVDYGYPNGDQTNKETQGLLYKWEALMNGESSSNSNPSGVQGISPEGWHIPSQDEFIELMETISNNQVIDDSRTHQKFAYISKEMASTSGWQESSTNNSPGYNQSENNSSRLSIYPSGSKYGNSYYYYGTTAILYSCTKENNNFIDCLFLEYNYTSTKISYNGGFNPNNYLPVRCVCNLTATEFREQMGLRGKVLVNDGEKWVAGDIADITIQSDWNQTTTTAPDYIKNKPSIPTISLENFNNTDWDYVFTI